MNYFKKIVDWVIQSYEPEKPKFKPKKFITIKVEHTT